MTDEKIIINGVDVSKCYRFSRKTGYCEGAFKPEELPFCENFDCYFKQLKRKEQECEELKEKIKKYSKINEQDTKDFANYKQVLDEIEKIISTPCISTINNCIECKCSSCLYKQVLNIINKAKGGE